jgi:LmbE family N-acetylglucosaminyl deacetylase
MPLRTLVVTAHPDDVDFGAAGTVATWTDAGDEVVYCLVTDGEAGGSDRSLPRPEMARTRRREQSEAARVVGVTELHFLGRPDGTVVAGLELRRDLTRMIRRVRPDRVLTQSPQRRFDRIYASHPDHLATGEATLCAVYPDARNPFAFPDLLAEGLEPHIVPEVLLMAGPSSDLFVDITDVFDRKIEALMRHQSQHPDPGRVPEMMRAWSTEVAPAGGLADGRRAEAFLRVDTR